MYILTFLMLLPIKHDNCFFIVCTKHSVYVLYLFLKLLLFCDTQFTNLLPLHHTFFDILYKMPRLLYELKLEQYKTL